MLYDICMKISFSFPMASTVFEHVSRAYLSNNSIPSPSCVIRLPPNVSEVQRPLLFKLSSNPQVQSLMQIMGFNKFVSIKTPSKNFGLTLKTIACKMAKFSQINPPFTGFEFNIDGYVWGRIASHFTMVKSFSRKAR